MPVTVASEGLIQTKVGTEHVITSADSSGVYVWTVDARSTVLGDVFTLRVKEQVRSGSGLGAVYLATYANCLFAPIIKSIPLTSVYSAAEFTVEVTSSGASGSGTGSNGPPLNWRLDNVN